MRRTLWKVAGPLVLSLALATLFAGVAWAREGGQRSLQGRSQPSVISSVGEKVTLVDWAKIDELARQRDRGFRVEESALSASDSGNAFWVVIVLAALALAGLGGWAARSKTFENLRLATKLGIGFGAVVLLALAIGTGGYFFLETVNDEYDGALGALDLDMMASEDGVLANEFVIYTAEGRARAETVLDEQGAKVKEYYSDIENMLGRGLDQAEQTHLAKLKTTVDRYDETFDRAARTIREIEQLRSKLDTLGTGLPEQTEELTAVAQELGRDESATRLLEMENLLLRLETTRIGFMYDKDIERISIAEKYLNVEFITGMGKRDEQFVIILNIDKVFSTDELLLVEKAMTAGAARLEQEAAVEAQA